MLGSWTPTFVGLHMAVSRIAANARDHVVFVFISSSAFVGGETPASTIMSTGERCDTATVSHGPACYMFSRVNSAEGGGHGIRDVDASCPRSRLGTCPGRGGSRAERFGARSAYQRQCHRPREGGPAGV